MSPTSISQRRAARERPRGASARNRWSRGGSPVDQASCTLRSRCHTHTSPRSSSAQHSSRASRLARRQSLRSAIASELPGSSKAATGVASRPTSLDYTVSVRQICAGALLFDHPHSMGTRAGAMAVARDIRASTGRRLTRGDGRSSPALASASGCSLAVAAAPTRRQLRLQLGSHLRRDRHGAHACPARGPRARPRATPARARPTPTGVRAARAAARPPRLHRRINPTARGCDSTSIAASVLASCPGPRMNGGPMVACEHRIASYGAEAWAATRCALPSSDDEGAGKFSARRPIEQTRRDVRR